MNRILFIPLFIIVSIISSACDPALFMMLENKSNQTNSITFNFSQMDRYNFGHRSYEGDSVAISINVDGISGGTWLKEGQKNSVKIELESNQKATLVFGWGSWNEETYREFTKSLDSIIININGEIKTITNKDNIFNFLKDSKKGGALEIVL